MLLKGGVEFAAHFNRYALELEWVFRTLLTPPRSEDLRPHGCALRVDREGAAVAGCDANPRQGRKPEMPETPTFGRYAEIPYDQMTPEQQEGYRLLIETRGALGGPNKV